MALILGVHALRSYLKLICQYELHSLPNKNVSGAKDHGKNYIKVRPLLVSHLLRNGLLVIALEMSQVRLLDQGRALMDDTAKGGLTQF